MPSRASSTSPIGLPLGDTGFVNLSLEYGNADPTNRSVQRADAAALIDGVGRGQRALETRREAQRQHGHRLLEPFAHTGRRAGMLLVETAGEVSQQPRRGLDVLTLIGALEGRQYPGPLTLRQMVEDVAGLVDLAALHQRGTTEHRRDRRP